MLVSWDVNFQGCILLGDFFLNVKIGPLEGQNGPEKSFFFKSPR